MYTPIIQNRMTGYYRTGAISHSPNRFFLGDKNVSHLVGPSEQFGTHEKLSKGVQDRSN